MLTPQRLLDHVSDQIKSILDPLIVFWFEVHEHDREELCRQIEALTGDAPVLPVVLRGGLFLDPNSIAADINRLIGEYQDKLSPSKFAHAAASGTPIVLVVLSRTAFLLPQISSPAVLPPWFPSHGGQTVMARIVDLSRSAEGPLNSPDVPMDELCRDLHALDRALVSRLLLVAAKEKQAANAFYSLLNDGKSSPEQYLKFLGEAQEYNRQVGTPEGFRPSVKQKCVTGALLKLFKAATADGLNRPATALKDALALEIPTELASADSILAVLFRPVEYDADPSKRFARNLLICVYATSQLVTARAHADAYPRFPIQLLQSVVRDLRRCLRATVQILERDTVTSA